MAAPILPRLRQVLRLPLISVRVVRAESGGTGPLHTGGSKTLVSFPVKFTAGFQDSVTGEDRREFPPSSIRPEPTQYIQEQVGQGPDKCLEGEGGASVREVQTGDEVPQHDMAGKGRGPQQDDDSSSSSDSSSDSEEEEEQNERSRESPRPVAEKPGVSKKESGSSSAHGLPDPKTSEPQTKDGRSPSPGHIESQAPMPKAVEDERREELKDQAPVIHTAGDVQDPVPKSSPPDAKIQDGSSPATGHVESDALMQNSMKHERREDLVDQAPVIHTEGDLQDPDLKTSAPCAEPQPQEGSSPLPGSVESQASVQTSGGDERSEELVDQAPVIHTEGDEVGSIQQVGSCEDKPVMTQEEGPGEVGLTRHGGEGDIVGEPTSSPESVVQETQTPAAIICKETGLVSGEEPTESTPPSAPSAAPEEPAFDNSTYQNLQHYSYSTFTFVDYDLDLSQFRLPQPSSGRPSPRH